MGLGNFQDCTFKVKGVISAICLFEPEEVYNTWWKPCISGPIHLNERRLPWKYVNWNLSSLLMHSILGTLVLHLILQQIYIQNASCLNNAKTLIITVYVLDSTSGMSLGHVFFRAIADMQSCLKIVIIFTVLFCGISGAEMTHFNFPWASKAKRKRGRKLRFWFKCGVRQCLHFSLPLSLRL